MVDETRTKCGRNGRNSDFVQNKSLVRSFRIDTYIRCISSAKGLNGDFVHKIDGVPFRDFESCRSNYFGQFSFRNCGINISKKY